MRNYLKSAALMGGVWLAALLGGCATQEPGQQVYLYCPPGYSLETDYLCHRRWVAPPPVNYAAHNPPASSALSSPPPGRDWGRDAATMGGAAAIGAVAGNQLAKHGAATVAGEVAGGEAVAVTGTVEADALETLLARGVAIIIEDWWWLL
jgi:hypothetical protein